MSSLRDDWLAINSAASEEGDPVISCAFKTEFVTHLMQQTNNGVQLLIGQNIQYAKKKEKQATIKFTRDEMVPRNDVYKSHEVRVPSGEPPNSISRPPAARKSRPSTSTRPVRAPRAGAAAVSDKRDDEVLTRPVLMSCYMSQKPRAAPPKPQPKAQALPTGAMPAPPPPPAALAGRVNGSSVAPPAPPPPFGSGAAAPRAAPAPPRAPLIPKAPLPPTSVSAPAARAAPPPPPVSRAAPPPPPPAAPSVPKWKVLYAFSTSEVGEMPLIKDELVEVEQKDSDGNGWWLVKKNGKTGWAPSNYLKEVVGARNGAPPPPALGKRAPPAPNGSSIAKSGPALNGSSGGSTPTGSIRGSAGRECNFGLLTTDYEDMLMLLSAATGADMNALAALLKQRGAGQG